MSQKKYQRLQSANMAAAEIIYNALKEKKAISHETFSRLYCQRPGGAHRSGSFNNLISNTQEFLYDHGIMSTHIINGLIVYVATQKCFRTKSFANATKETQLVTNDAIDRAIKYVELNNNQIPAEYEGPIVANILGLEGGHFKSFVERYVYQGTWNSDEKYGLGIKYKVLGPIHEMAGYGLVKIN